MSKTNTGFFDVAQAALEKLVDGGISPIIQQAQIAAASWHPNGFVVFELGDHALGALRLHIWPTSPRHLRGDSAHVHTHVWDLSSRVLSGTYSERLFYSVTGEAGETFLSADIDYGRDRNTLELTGSTSMRSSAVQTFKRGEVHTVKAGIPHETLVPLNSYAATLLITSDARLERATVYSLDALPLTSHTRKPIDGSLRNQLLDELKTKMEGDE